MTALDEFEAAVKRAVLEQAERDAAVRDAQERVKRDIEAAS